MFQLNDIVVHYRDGVATITGTIEMNGQHFFTIKASRVDDVLIYVPILTASDIIRKVMSLEDANSLIEYMNNLPEVYISNTKQRRDDFKRRLASGNLKDTAFLTKMYLLHKTDSFTSENVKLGQMDVDMLKDAYNRLTDELCIVYNVDTSNIQEFLGAKLNLC
jgi:RNA polymerase-interacting CarD/CdnL/TRCF family regulator